MGCIIELLKSFKKSKVKILKNNKLYHLRSIKKHKNLNIMDSSKKLFSRMSIFLFSIIGSTLMGSILYSMNLKTLQKTKSIIPIILASALYTFGGIKLLTLFHIPSYFSYLILHLIGGLIISVLLWKFQIGGISNYEPRKTANVLAIFLLIIMLLIIINISFK
jgi:hypothetical protein